MKKLLKRILKKIYYTFYPPPKYIPEYIGNNFVCPICDTNLKYFNMLDRHYFEKLEMYGYVHPIFMAETGNLVNFTCPVCSNSDRERLYALYLLSLSEKGKINKDMLMLEIAPFYALSNFIRNRIPITYRTCDLNLENVDDKVDITDMNIYSSEQFDIILCSHVLEHIKEETKALTEIYRILKKDGIAVIMVPILLSIEETIENDEYDTPEKKWKYYGHGDHVRMYSKKGFIRSLMNAGFKVNELGSNYFTNQVLIKTGISENSILYIATK